MAEGPNWRTVMPFLVGLLCFGILALWDHQRDFGLWRNYALSGIVLGSGATWVFWHYDVRLPHYIQWMMVVGLLLHYVGGSVGSPDPYRMGLLGTHGINGAYHTYDWWDNVTHGVGIGASAMGIAYLLEVYQVRRGLQWRSWAVGTLALMAALAAGVGVELYEYVGKTLFQTIDQGGYTNTMTDLVFNFLGATAGATLAVTANRRVFWARIKSHWTVGPPVGGPWHRRVPPDMAGFIAFVTIPAVTAVGLALRFLVGPPELQDLTLYDESLQVLVRSAVAAFVAAPLVAMASREVGKRMEAASS